MSDHKPSARAQRVWKKFTQWYGPRFVDMWGHKAPEDWSEVIDRESDATLDSALLAVRTAHIHHPPNLPEFEQALAKARAPVSTEKPPDLRMELTRFVHQQHASGAIFLGERQLYMAWTWLERRFDAPDADGKMKSRHGCEIVGVVIPAQGVFPEHRILVSHMRMQAAA